MKERIEKVLKKLCDSERDAYVALEGEDYQRDKAVHYEIGNIRNALYSNKPHQLAFMAFAGAVCGDWSYDEIEKLVSAVDWQDNY